MNFLVDKVHLDSTVLLLGHSDDVISCLLNFSGKYHKREVGRGGGKAGRQAQKDK